uniref:Uncharacterized protein n=1 Tax=Arundo donax TaxID=35708 RepID=A0A0A9G5R7_ARUDO
MIFRIRGTLFLIIIQVYYFTFLIMLFKNNTFIIAVMFCQFITFLRVRIRIFLEYRVLLTF